VAIQQSVSALTTPKQTATQQQSPYQVNNAKNWAGFTNEAQKINAIASPYEQDVQKGLYLDVRNNPFAQGYADAIGQNFQEQMGRQLSQVSSPFAGAGGTMGMSGIHGAMRGMAEDQGSQNLANELSGMYSNLYSQERGLQQQVSSDLSQRTDQLVASAAQAYGVDGAIRQSQIAARAAVKQAQIAARLGYAQLAWQKIREAEALEQSAYQLKINTALATGQLMGGFGQQTNTPQQLSSKAGAIQGGGSGVAGGFGYNENAATNQAIRDYLQVSAHG
jgi:hypothetical protein